MSEFLVKNIDWDTTDQYNPDNANNTIITMQDLPTEIRISTTDINIDDDGTDEKLNEIADAISDYLSDKYGFRHNGFTLSEL